MRVAIVTANTGDIDEGANERFFQHDIKYDRFYYHEGNLPFPLPNLNNRLKSKYVKMMMHRFLPDYNAYVWLDSSVEINDPKFIDYIIEGLNWSPMTITLHHERNNAYEEIDYILEQIASDKEYLVGRYKNQPLVEERDFYEIEGLPKEYPLYISRFFARKNETRINQAFDDWWLRVLEFANFDQSMFSYIAWKHRIPISTEPYQHVVDKFLTIHKHK